MTEAGETREKLQHNEGNAATDGIWRVTDAGGASRILKIGQWILKTCAVSKVSSEHWRLPQPEGTIRCSSGDRKSVV